MAVAHVQFEAIHPFSDGNGRVGRLLPPLYLAGYLKANQRDYLLFAKHALNRRA